MANVHNRKSKAFRPDEKTEYKPALANLDARGLKIGGYLRACLRALNANPDATLDSIAKHWPTDEGEQPAWTRALPTKDQPDDASSRVPSSS